MHEAHMSQCLCVAVSFATLQPCRVHPSVDSRPLLLPTLIISSKVSSSISTVVTVSSTSPKMMFKCWSYACSRASCSCCVHAHTAWRPR
jgi:hypothetical protein